MDTLPVAVVVPHLRSRQEFFLDRCLPAIMENRPFETIVVREGTNPASRRNIGARVAKSEFLYFCDDDVVMKPGTLERMIAALRATPGAVFAYGDVEHVAHPGSPRRDSGIYKAFEFDKNTLQKRNYISNMSLIRRAHFPGYDEAFEMLEDWDLWLTISENGGAGVYIPEVFHESHHIDAGLLRGGSEHREWGQKVRVKHG